jgi:hypothetical protein
MKLNKIAAILGVVGSIAASGYAYAATYYTEYAYYSDASYTVWVGEKITTCTGKVYSYGTVTLYRQLVERYDCSRPIP